MEGQRNLKDAGMREAYIVSWRKGNGSSQMEAFQTEEGAQEYIKRNGLKARCYKGVVMAGIFSLDEDRRGMPENPALGDQVDDQGREGTV